MTGTLKGGFPSGILTRVGREAWVTGAMALSSEGLETARSWEANDESSSASAQSRAGVSGEDTRARSLGTSGWCQPHRPHTVPASSAQEFMASPVGGREWSGGLNRRCPASRCHCLQGGWQSVRHN